MISAEHAIREFRKGLALAAAARMVLLLGVIIALCAPMIGWGSSTSLILFALGTVWLVLSFRSARGTQLASTLGPLIASGEYASMVARRCSLACSSSPRV